MRFYFTLIPLFGLLSCAPTVQKVNAPDFLQPGQVWQLQMPPTGNASTDGVPIDLSVGEIDPKSPSDGVGFVGKPIVSNTGGATTSVFYFQPKNKMENEFMVGGYLFITSKKTSVSLLCHVLNPSVNPSGILTGLFTSFFNDISESVKENQEQAENYIKTGQFPKDARTCTLRRIK
jgi:hypothetical protein